MNFKSLDEKIKKKRRKQISFERLLKSFTYAKEGIKYTLINEQNLIVHSICAILVIIFGFIFIFFTNIWIVIKNCNIKIIS